MSLLDIRLALQTIWASEAGSLAAVGKFPWMPCRCLLPDDKPAVAITFRTRSVGLTVMTSDQ